MLTVKKLADLLGLSPEVIRHYTHMGILKPVVNSGNNYKYYDEQDLLYLANIRVNRSLGLSLPQAQDFQSGSVQDQRNLLAERSQQLSAEIEKLQKLQKRLTEVETFLAQAEMCTMEGVVKDVRRDPIHSVYTYGLKKPHTDQLAIVQQWSKLFPFVHFSVKIPKEEYINRTFRLRKELVDRMEVICNEKNISLNKLTVLCIEYALDNLEEDDTTLQ